MVALLAGGTGIAWWLSGDDGDPLADRPRVTDTDAGLTYAIPEGWEHDEDNKLLRAFTSRITQKSAAGTEPRTGIETGTGLGAGRGTGTTDASVVLAGHGPAIKERYLRSTAQHHARSHASFFFPDGDSERVESVETEVDGRPAHTVVQRVEDGGGGTAHLRMTVVSAAAGTSAFLLGIGPSEDNAEGAEGAEGAEVHQVLENAELL